MRRRVLAGILGGTIGVLCATAFGVVGILVTIPLALLIGFALATE